MSIRRNWLYWAAGLLAMLAMISVGGAVNAAFPPPPVNTAGTAAVPDVPKADDGFDQLPRGLQAVSYSTLVNMGLVHPDMTVHPAPKDQPAPPNVPLLNIVWGPAVDVSGNSGGTFGTNEPAASMHPIDPLRALAGGNTYSPPPVHANVETTTDGGVTWLRQPSTNNSGNGDGVPVWVPGGTGNHAVYTALTNGSPPQLSASRSTDSGVTWTNLGNSPAIPAQFNDREYLWKDRNPASPYYGRIYVTFTEFDSGASGSFDTIVVRYSTDEGTSWSTPVSVVDPLTLNTQGLSQFGSLAVQPDGGIVAGWRQGTFGGTNTTKFKWSRSTDGGATFPISGTIATIPVNQSISFNTTSPGGFRWGDAPTITADPTDGTLYMSFISLRTAGNTSSAATYVARSSNNGATWSTPVIVDNSQPTRYQYFPWIAVSKDHTVHVQYGAQASATASNVAQFYAQSTDLGVTWSAPFMLSNASYTATGFMGDYQGMDIGADAGSNGVIFPTWTDVTNGERRWGRLGTFLQGTPTPTVTGTPPTATQTRTPTQTPTATGTSTPTATVNPCLVSTYTFATGTATIVPGTVNTGSACDDCDTAITLPFPFTLYGQVFTTVNASSNGRLDFATMNEPGGYSNTCLPAAPNVGPYAYTIFAHWDDLLTTGATDGIFTSVSGVAPNRIFNIEWRTTYFAGAGTANFEVRLYEGQTRFDLVYGALAGGGTGATTGVQGPNNTFTQYSCNTALASGLLVTFTQPPCATPTAGPSNTPTAPPTNTQTATAVASPTSAASSTATVTATGTPCPVQFNDVPVGSTFYDYVRCLACRGIVGGYPCGGPGEPCPGNYYRPNNNVTRGQVSKIVSESAGFNDVIPSTQQTFEDVAPGSTFALWVERLSVRGIIGGYPCGGPFEPCVAPTNRPYFRPNNNVTRGQLSKITSGAAGWTETPTGQTFEDVAVGSTFYVYIERMAARGIISGYPCGGPFEPCVAPANRPYFRPNNNATRGQMSKIAASAFFPNCSTPVRQ